MGIETTDVETLVDIVWNASTHWIPYQSIVGSNFDGIMRWCCSRNMGYDVACSRLRTFISFHIRLRDAFRRCVLVHLQLRISRCGLTRRSVKPFQDAHGTVTDPFCMRNGQLVTVHTRVWCKGTVGGRWCFVGSFLAGLGSCILCRANRCPTTLYRNQYISAQQKNSKCEPATHSRCNRATVVLHLHTVNLYCHRRLAHGLRVCFIISFPEHQIRLHFRSLHRLQRRWHPSPMALFTIQRVEHERLSARWTQPSPPVQQRCISPTI